MTFHTARSTDGWPGRSNGLSMMGSGTTSSMASPAWPAAAASSSSSSLRTAMSLSGLELSVIT